MKRKSRNKLVKKESVNMMEPLQFDKLGSAEDPCFGKLHDYGADECKVCGDAEICSIVCSQKLHAKRKLIEEKQDFKDLQNLECRWQDVSKQLKRRLKKISPQPLPKLKTIICKKLGIHESEFDKHLNTILKKGNGISLKENKLKYTP